jgi:hypothetical protein
METVLNKKNTESEPERRFERRPSQRYTSRRRKSQQEGIPDRTVERVTERNTDRTVEMRGNDRVAVPERVIERPSERAPERMPERTNEVKANGGLIGSSLCLDNSPLRSRRTTSTLATNVTEPLRPALPRNPPPEIPPRSDIISLPLDNYATIIPISSDNIEVTPVQVNQQQPPPLATANIIANNATTNSNKSTSSTESVKLDSTTLAIDSPDENAVKEIDFKNEVRHEKLSSKSYESQRQINEVVEESNNDSVINNHHHHLFDYHHSDYLHLHQSHPSVEDNTYVNLPVKSSHRSHSLHDEDILPPLYYTMTNKETSV